MTFPVGQGLLNAIKDIVHMDLRLIIRKIFNIPNREYKELYRKYTDAERELDTHISGIRPYQPLTGDVTYQEGVEQVCQHEVSLFSPIKYPRQTKTGDSYSERIKSMGLTVESYNTIVTLCQRAEKAYAEGDLSSALAILDGLDEIRLPNKAKVLQDYMKKLQTRIK